MQRAWYPDRRCRMRCPRTLTRATSADRSRRSGQRRTARPDDQRRSALIHAGDDSETQGTLGWSLFGWVAYDGLAMPSLRAGRPTRCAALALASAASLAFGAHSAAASPSAKLVYVRGTGTDVCPGEEDLRRAVATRIGYDPFFPAAQKTVIAQVTRTAGGYRGKVQIVGDDGKVWGERDLASKGDDCLELVSAMALAVSIALDDLDEATQAPPAPPASPSSSAPDEPAPPREVPRAEPAREVPAPPRSAPAEGPHVELRASAGPIVSVGTAPAAAFGGSAAVSLGYGAVGARLGVRGELPSSGAVTPTGLVSTSTLLVTLSGCVRARVPFGCVGGGIGSFSSQTEGITRPASDSATLGVLLASAGADLALGRVLYLEPVIEGALNLTRHRVEIDGSRAFTLPIVAGTLGLHLGGHFF